MAKPQPILSHMPRLVKEQIVNSSDFASKQSVRQCSKEFKQLVDLSKSHLSVVEFRWFAENVAWIGIVLKTNADNVKSVVFLKKADGCLKNETVKDGSYTTAAVEQLMKILKNSRVTIATLRIIFHDHYTSEGLPEDKEEILEALEEQMLTLNHQIHVERVELTMTHRQGEYLHVLPYLKPGVLKTIQLHPRQDKTGPESVWRSTTEKLAELEQWKQADALLLGRHFMERPADQVSHFKAMSYCVRYWKFPLEDVKKTIEKVLRNDNCDFVQVYRVLFNLDEICQYLKQFEKLPEEDATTYRIRSGDSECLVREDYSDITIWSPTRCQGKNYD